MYEIYIYYQLNENYQSIIYNYQQYFRKIRINHYILSFIEYK